jgi:HK97 family phage portal protein
MMRSTFEGLATAVRNAVRVPLTASGTGRRGMLGGLASRDRGSQLAAMGSVSTLFAIAGRLANATAQTEWYLYRDNPPNVDPKTPCELVPNHAAINLWNKPNPFMTRSEFVESFQQHVELVGESEWLVSRLPGFDVPMELWPLRPDRMQPVPDPEAYLLGWTYSAFGVTEDLGRDEVIQIRMPNPEDPYRGLGPVQTLLADLDSVRYSAEWNRRFFLNDATPGGIIEYPDEMSDPQFKRLQQRWTEQHRGVRNAHRVAILEKGKWVDRAFSMRDMQFVQLRTVSRDIIREAFGFPKPMLGETVSVRAEAEASEYIFAKWLLVSRLERVKQALNNDLLPMYGELGKGVHFNYVSPVADDVAALTAALSARASAAATLRAAGWDADDVLAVCGLPSMKLANEGVSA